MKNSTVTIKDSQVYASGSNILIGSVAPMTNPCSEVFLTEMPQKEKEPLYQQETNLNRLREVILTGHVCVLPLEGCIWEKQLKPVAIFSMTSEDLGTYIKVPYLQSKDNTHPAAAPINTNYLDHVFEMITAMGAEIYYYEQGDKWFDFNKEKLSEPEEFVFWREWKNYDLNNPPAEIMYFMRYLRGAPIQSLHYIPHFPKSLLL